MKNLNFFIQFKNIAVFFILFQTITAFGQNSTTGMQSDFWKKVQIGGGLGLNFGSGFTDVTVAPSAIYNFNEYVAAGVGLQGSYVRVRNNYESYIYGGSLIGIFNPFEQIQVSAELEQLRVNTNFYESGFLSKDENDNFWNTALYLGLGYRTENVTVGIRYNVLYNANKSVYSEPFMPFVRVYF